jgi:hypothetical protein
MNKNIFNLDFLILVFEKFKDKREELSLRLHDKLYGILEESHIAFLVSYLCNSKKIQRQYRTKAMEYLKVLESRC